MSSTVVHSVVWRHGGVREEILREREGEEGWRERKGRTEGGREVEEGNEGER